MSERSITKSPPHSRPLHAWVSRLRIMLAESRTLRGGRMLKWKGEVATAAPVAALMVLSAGSAEAQTWTGATSTDWTVGSNWSGGVVPTTGTVTISTTASNPTVLGVSGAATRTSGSLLVGNVGGQSGSLTIQNGSTLTSNATGFSYVGRNGGTGVVNVTGAGSNWTVTGVFNSVLLGETSGTGTLNVSNSGSVVTAGDLVVGERNGGTGFLSVTSGGTVSTGRDAYIARRLSGTSQGTAIITGAGSSWTIASRLLVANGGVGALTIADNAKVSVATSTTVADSGGAGTLNISGGGILETQSLTRAAGTTAQVNFNGGVLQARANNANFITGFAGTELNVAAGGLTIDTAGFNVGTDAASALTGVGGLTKTGVGTLSLAANNTFAGETLVQAGTLALTGAGSVANSSRIVANSTFDISGLTGAGTNIRSLAGGGAVNLGTKMLTLTNANDTFSGIVSGSGGLTLSGGTQTLTGANTYSGGTTISAGTLQIGDGGTSGSIVGPIVNNGTLAFNRAGTVTLSGAITGSGRVEQNGTGTTILTGGNGYSGGTFLNAGVLSVSSITNLGNSSLTFNGGTLQNTGAINSFRPVTLQAGGGTFQTDATFQQGSVISGTGGLNKTGSGTLVLLNNGNNYTGGTTISAGTLSVGNGSTNNGVLPGDVVNNATLAFNLTGTKTFGGVISGSGAVNQIGPGITILTGTNSYTGATTVTAGTLLINGDQSAATGPTNVNGGTLGGIGIIGGSVNVASGGTIAPGGVGNVPGTLTIQQNLSLADGSTLNFNFGRPNEVGGTFNDHIVVGGDLTLDGTINVSLSSVPGSNFGPGFYRVITYNPANTFINNGLDLGTMPPGSDVFVQTSIPGQVNLVNTAGLTLNYWDGDAGPKNDGVINGGNGVWQSSAGNDNWTSALGTPNAPFSDGAFAIFAGAPGTVTVDNSLGQVTVSGMQLGVSGYVIQGGSILLTGPTSEVRVGDGSPEEVGYTATIASELTGAAELLKTGLGTLILTGNNGYSGGTNIQAGTLQVSSDANLGLGGSAVTLDGGTLRTTASFTSNRPSISRAPGRSSPIRPRR